MPYQNPDGRLPSENASKLGHVKVIKSEWVRSLIDDFEASEISVDLCNTVWKEFPEKSESFEDIWITDGSFSIIEAGNYPKKQLAFVKTALMKLDKMKIDAVDKKNPHPLQIKNLMSQTAEIHSTVLPLNNIRTSKGTNYDAVRNIIFDSMRIDENGQYYETLKWLAYEKWNPTSNEKSPGFKCPQCGNEKDIEGFPFDADKMDCPYCNKEVLLTDMLSFHLNMLEDYASVDIVSSYMLILETLMLFTPIRLYWERQDPKLESTLFIKDGPLSLSSQYTKIVPKIRAFLQYAFDSGKTVHIIGCEKSGKFFDHLMSIKQFAPPANKDDKPHYSVLSHKYIVEEVQRRARSQNQYGSRTNWGEKVYVKLEPNTCIVLNIPTGDYNISDNFPIDADMIGLDRILATIPSLISRKFEGALYPIELANSVASMSSYPSAKILERYVEEKVIQKQK